ncbi:sensor histidine kinase [Roseateles sp.]|uniref:sensor histidine kinase n=1 Tax=Roseateles sp. TaxID=1971397 RepID=UPI0025F838AE|nr:sensor histidine kinase [Roseateles sp.]MBV8037689.1 sensor histidine kinase N-terminal domain-containing protein [Roseateles sp.]
MKPVARRWLQRELQWRLALPVLGMVLVGGLFSALGTEYLVDKVFDRWLFDAARSLAAEVRHEGGRAQIALSHQAETMLLYDVVDHVDFAVLDGDRLLAGSPGIPLSGSNERRYGATSRAFDAVYGGHEVRVAWVDTGTPAARVGVAETLKKRAQTRRDLLLVFLPLGLVVVLAAFVVARGVRRTVSPLETLAARWNQRAHLSLDAMPTDEVPRELLPFATALNDMLQRLRGVLEREQRFASTAAHQLRTPLTALQLGLARAAEASDLASARGVLEELGETTQRTARLVQQLLALSRLDPELAKTTAFSRLDVQALAHAVGLAYQDVAADRGIRLEFEETTDGLPVLIRGQAELISEALGNLVDNALRYTPAGGLVRIAVSAAPPTLAVHDGGPGVPEHEKERIFERFARGSTAQGAGTGLGLAIVKEIAELHGATVRLARSPCGGALFSLVFEA